MTAYFIFMYLLSLALAYVLAFTGATLKIGRSLSDAGTATGYQDAITPPNFSTVATIVYITCTLGLIYGFWSLGWLLGSAAAICFFAALAINKYFLLPKSESDHFRRIILQSMVRRHANYHKEGDAIRAMSIGMLLKKLGIPVEDLISRLANTNSLPASDVNALKPAGTTSRKENESPKTLGIDSPERAVRSMCITQASVYLEMRLPQVFGRAIVHNRKGSSKIADRHYDIYSFLNPYTSKNEECFFDISAFFGRGDIYSPKLDLPPPGTTMQVEQILGGDAVFQAIGIRDASDPEKAFAETMRLNQVPVTFKQFSSEMLSRYIVLLYPEDRALEITPIRSYDENKIPILHGFQFYQLFIIHALYHILQDYDQRATETAPKADYYNPVISKDCVQFEPLPVFNFANDFINYTFWTHRPGAFQEKNEVYAFNSSATYALGKGLMKKAELLAAIQAARPDQDTVNSLTSVVNDISYG